MSQEHPGLLGAIMEACEIQQQLGCSADEAHEIQRKRADERSRERELAAAESNVIHIDFRKTTL